jgi:hypothetical protein
MPRTPPDSQGASAARTSDAGPRKPYERPRLIDYGPVSKLTQTNGITVQDNGNMKQVCL